MNLPYNPDLKIIDPLWDNFDSKWNSNAAKVQRRASECPSGSLEDYFWRLLQEIT